MTCPLVHLTCEINGLKPALHAVQHLGGHLHFHPIWPAKMEQTNQRKVPSRRDKSVLLLCPSHQDETLTKSDEVIVSGSARSNQKWHVVLEPIFVAGKECGKKRKTTTRKPLHVKQLQLPLRQSWMWHSCRDEDASVSHAWPFPAPFIHIWLFFMLTYEWGGWRCTGGDGLLV